MKKVVSLNKPIGLTPYQMVSRFKTTHPEYKNVKISYAGRLDPMAHGIVLLLIGEENKKRDKYLHLQKTYIFQALFSLQTDTFDLLGIVNSINKKAENLNKTQLKTLLEKFCKSKTGTSQQQYPSYSSKTVNGKPLYWWARKSRLHEINIPARQINIETFTLNNIEEISKLQLQTKIQSIIPKINGDFRQEEILRKWNQNFQLHHQQSFTIATFTITCSTGTYIRTLVHELGNFLQTGAIAYDIKRIKVGDYDLKNIFK